VEGHVHNPLIRREDAVKKLWKRDILMEKPCGRKKCTRTAV
jgi:hypothetical protein